jgi:ankyrin repeat protein
MTKVIVPDYHDHRVLEMAKERLMLEEFLVKESNISVQDEKGRNALYWAIQHRHKHNVKILLKYNVSLMVTHDTHALFHTIESNDIDIFMHIFALSDIDVNIRDKNGATLIMKAIEHKSINIARYLINKGADLYLADNKGKTASDYIEDCDHQDLYNLVYYRIVYEKSVRA